DERVLAGAVGPEDRGLALLDLVRAAGVPIGKVALAWARPASLRSPRESRGSWDTSGVRACEVVAGRRAQRALEHRGEGRGRVVAQVDGDPRDGLAGGEQRHRGEEPRLLTPSREGEAGFLLEEARERAGGGSGLPPPSLERAGVPG